MFKRLCANCPNHQIPEQLLIQYFYEGIIPKELFNIYMIDVASGENLVDKTPQEAWNLIANMVGNTQSFLARQENVKKVDMSNSSSVEQQLSTLTNIVDKLDHMLM